MNPLQLMQMVGELRNNPMAALSKFGVPQNMANDPQQIIRFLMNNGNVSQNQYNDAIRQAQNMGIKI